MEEGELGLTLIRRETLVEEGDPCRPWRTSLSHPSLFIACDSVPSHSFLLSPLSIYLSLSLHIYIYIYISLSLSLSFALSLPDGTAVVGPGKMLGA